MKLTEAQQENLTNCNFAGGHMFYSWDDSREAFQIEAERFYESAISGERTVGGEQPLKIE